MATASDTPRTEASPPSDSEKPKVIYVMGRGKSGSTILGVTLGNCSDVFFAGELCNWLIASGKPSFKGAERTRFWQGVSEDVDAGAEPIGATAFQRLERAASAFRPDKWFARRRLRQRYRPITEDLYRSISARAGARYVIDTSHLPLRARELQSMSGIDLYLIFLVRDVESVVASYMQVRRKRNPAPRRRKRSSLLNAYLWTTYLISVIVFLRQPRDRRLVLRYEDFIANPEGVLREILDVVGCASELPDLASLSTGIPLRSNALVRSPVVELKAKPEQPYRRSRLMRLAQYPWTLILSRLQPAATGAGAPHSVPAGDRR